MTDARAGLAVQLEAFAANTMEYLRRERELLLDGVGVPDITTELDGRHALVVVRGYHYKEDLQTLRHYIREFRPVLIGVDGGADALLEAGHRPDLIVGDMDSVSDATLTCGAEVVVHAYRDGNAPGLERVRKPRASTRSSSRRPAPARTSRCCSPTTRAPSSSSPSAPTPRSWSSSTRAASGMASTFLTRLRVGGKLVDAKGVSRLYRSRISNLSLARHAARRPVRPVRRPGRRPPAARPCSQLVGARWDDVVVPRRRDSSRDRLPLPPRLHRLDLPGPRGGDRARCRSAQGGPGQHADPRGHPAAAGQDRPARRARPPRSRASPRATPGPSAVVARGGGRHA